VPDDEIDLEAEVRAEAEAAVNALWVQYKKDYEALTLAEIGQVLGVTESRVCQIHTKAILQLRARMSEPA